MPRNLCSALGFTAPELSQHITSQESPVPGWSCSPSPPAGALILNKANPASSQAPWTPRIAQMLSCHLSLLLQVSQHKIFLLAAHHSQRWDFCTGKSRCPHTAGPPRLGFRVLWYGKGFRAAPESCPCQSLIPWPACTMLEPGAFTFVTMPCGVSHLHSQNPLQTPNVSTGS